MPVFALFATPASAVLQWADIPRRHNDPHGPQRKLSQARINAIKRFFELDPRNTIPPAVTVTLDLREGAVRDVEGVGEVVPVMKILEFDVPENVAEVTKPGLVIDGQHRLYGMAEFAPNCMVNVVALLNVGPLEKAFQFLVINNKAARVRSDNLRTLALDYQEQQLATRLQTARLTLDENLKHVGIMDVDAASPFRGQIELVSRVGDEGQRFVAPSAIENSVSVIQGKGVRELESEDALFEFFYAMWTPIKSAWPDLWTRESKLMSKVGIVSMTSFITEALVSRYDWGQLDVTDPESLHERVDDLLRFQTPKFWRCEWNVQINDSRAVRDLIVKALTKVARNLRGEQPWHNDVGFVSL